MSVWVRLDNGFPEHPKVIGLTDAAFRLEVEAMCYAHRNLTDGLVPPTYARGRLRAAHELEAARLWVPGPEGGWLLHDYLAWQNSRAAVEDARKRMSEGGRRGAAKRWGTDDETP